MYEKTDMQITSLFLLYKAVSDLVGSIKIQTLQSKKKKEEESFMSKKKRKRKSENLAIDD